MHRRGFSVPETLQKVEIHSPYLTRLMELYPDVVDIFKANTSQAAMEEWIADIFARQTEDTPAAKGRLFLRIYKQKISLLIALEDMAKRWSLEQVTHNLSRFADACTQYALEQCYRAALPKTALEAGKVMSASSGIMILGMGKLGGFELNYSSDIDLIALYDPEKLDFLAPPARNRFAVRLIQQLASFLQDKQEGGYVFRVDLRLRPDPASTGLAVALNTAISYYEKAGQNWERAAMIKARPIAGDMEVAEQFMEIIQSFIWRNHLDFAAIDDILSIKRQMQAVHEPEITLLSHHMKTGYGAIREIEFLAQIHQLIWGGRVRELRLRPTCKVLEKLASYELISEEECAYLQESYKIYRLIEHRLQMRHDQQTHIMPAFTEDIVALADFCGYADAELFQHDVLERLNAVHRFFAEAFHDSAPLGFGGKLVFTGVEHDVDTLHTLRTMGFKHPEDISLAIQQWHKGSKRCTRTKRAREILTELVPLILSELSATVNPDRAFHHFDAFLTALPVGVQPFSLFNLNRPLLSVVAAIVGNAPVLAGQLSHYPQLLDILVDRSSHAGNDMSRPLSEIMEEWLGLARGQEEWVEYFCNFKREQEFRLGVELLERRLDADDASEQLTALASQMIRLAVENAVTQLEQKYASPPPLHFGVIGLGKLGTCELMIGSDLDVMFVYDVPASADEASTMQAHDYYTRLTARVIHLLSHPTKTGNLYEMDMKLRPYGAQSAVAVKLEGFRDYYANAAWVVEHLALIQGRVVYASEAMRTPMQRALEAAKKVDIPYPQLIEQMHDVRKKISAQHYSANPWDIKYVWGGLMDMQWIVKTLMAKYGMHTALPSTAHSTSAQLKWLYGQDILSDRQYQSLLDAHSLFHCTLSYLRLCHGDKLDEQSITEGLQLLLASVTGFRDFSQLKQQLLRLQAQVYHIYQNLAYM